MAFTSGLLAFAAPSPTLNAINDTSKVRKTITSSHLSCSTSSSSVTSNITTIKQEEVSKKFSYTRASPSVRWPNCKEPADNHNSIQTQSPTPKIDAFEDESLTGNEIEGKVEPLEMNNETLEYSGRNSRAFEFFQWVEISGFKHDRKNALPDDRDFV
ncbi:hypothetical protein L1887_00361 [Cichorium endivia]|nr:hypothetical protein L1887_00361 [Cichorium endivia]